jgi:hypothetical protein
LRVRDGRDAAVAPRGRSGPLGWQQRFRGRRRKRRHHGVRRGRNGRPRSRRECRYGRERRGKRLGGGSAGTASGGTPAAGGASIKGSGGARAIEDGGTVATGGSFGGSAGAATANQSLFADDFEGAAKNWISVPSDGWSVVSDGTKVFRQGTLDNELRVSSAGDAAWTDEAVEARVKVLAFTGSSTSYLAGVFVRFKDLDNHYFVALQSDGHVKIKKKSAGSSTSVSSQADATIAPGTWYTVKLAVKGSTLTAYLDGKEVLTATDADIPSGGFALGTKNATAEFDDV